MKSNKPRVSYNGTDMYEKEKQAWSTTSHSGLLMKYNPMQEPCIREHTNSYMMEWHIKITKIIKQP